MPISDSPRPSAPVVGYDRVTRVPLCEHGDDAEACQLRHKSPTDPAPIEHIEDIPAELRELFITHVKAARHVADCEIKHLYRKLAGARQRGYTEAVATLADVADHTGSPAARWAAEYLAADPDHRAPGATRPKATEGGAHRD